MLENIKLEMIRFLSMMQIQRRDEAEALEKKRAQEAEEELRRAKTNAAKVEITNQPKVGRNDPCPCESGKKYKQCCGKIA
jgi:preprotein translocase subunit SecA